MTEREDFENRIFFVTKFYFTWNMHIATYAHGADDGRNGNDGVGGWTSDVKTR